MQTLRHHPWFAVLTIVFVAFLLSLASGLYGMNL
jgi:hypothetical protein